MSILYQTPQGVYEIKTSSHPVLSTKQGGRVALDRRLISLWRSAGGNELDVLIKELSDTGVPEIETRSALLCLAEAELLTRVDETKTEVEYAHTEGELVSVIIVSFNSREWLKSCLPSLNAQTYSPVEVIVVDNASTDGSADWIEDNYPAITLIRLGHNHSLAGAINRGVKQATGIYYLLLNPDVLLEPDLIAQMRNVAHEDAKCAAVAAKLRYLWAPSFINSIGNFVGGFYWGTDIALGHLDLGQYDNIREVPSACFAATLIPAWAWNRVGELDQGFFLYYEDSEWCYRSRLYGYHIRLAPNAVVYHAFGGHSVPDENNGMQVSKYHHVIYGRLRFITKLLSWNYWIRFFAVYLIEDCLGIILAFIRGRVDVSKNYLLAWRDFIQAYPDLQNQRAQIQTGRVISDWELFDLQRKVPSPLIWHGVPLLTWDIIQNKYLPQLIESSQSSYPEFPASLKTSLGRSFHKENLLVRIIKIIQSEGIMGLLQRLWRYTQSCLMKT